MDISLEWMNLRKLDDCQRLASNPRMASNEMMLV